MDYVVIVVVIVVLIVVVAANIFLGQTEAPLLIKPFLGVMTK
jgi:nucleoside permease NupC